MAFRLINIADPDRYIVPQFLCCHNTVPVAAAGDEGVSILRNNRHIGRIEILLCALAHNGIFLQAAQAFAGVYPILHLRNMGGKFQIILFGMSTLSFIAPKIIQALTHQVYFMNIGGVCGDDGLVVAVKRVVDQLAKIIFSQVFRILILI